MTRPTHYGDQSSNSKYDVCSEVVVSPLVGHGLQVEVRVEQEPEGDGDHSQPKEPKKKVDGEHQELETGVTAAQSHLASSCEV